MSSTVSDCTELPPEVRARPLALVALAGLDTVNNAVHRAVWDAFSARRADRAPLRFKLLPNTFELPVVKPKRTSYEWYIPKGILKKNWIPKRLSLVPAVIVVFYDMEWDDPQWNEKILECASRVQSIRAACEGHGTRAAVVVLQGAPAPPPTEYPLGAERAQALCAACEIQSKALFVLGQGASLAGYAARLEAALLDLAHSYYHHEARAVRSHRDLLNKTTHHYLLVRHQFKLGFLNELKQDSSAAHKHYQHAYSGLLDMRTVDTNLHEVRTVAGFLNYKLCRLLFALNLPRDAIAQHRAHVEHYGVRGGPPALHFEHCAWLARQHCSFGELFEEAVRAGLPASRAHHPGLYYREAARLTARRRQAMRAVCLQAQSPPSLDILAGPTDHYGQRPWRPGRLAPEPPDSARELAAIQALQYNERNFNHSALIISFLGAAITQFKAFHSPRMRKQLVVEMAEEYHLSGDYGKALTLLGHMLWDYRRERWWGLATRVLTRAMQCAYLAGRLPEYLPLALEALAPPVLLSSADRARVFANVVALLDLRPPEPEPGLPEPAATSAIAQWRACAAEEPRALTIDMSAIASFLRVKATFTRPAYRVDEPVTVAVHARLSHCTALPISAAFLTVTTHSRTLDLPLTVDGRTAFHLHGDKVNEYSCRFELHSSDCGSDLQIKNVSFVLGSDDKRKLILNFKTDESKSDSATHPELLHSIPSPAAEYEFTSAATRHTAAVRPRESRLEGSFLCRGPALRGEVFPITVTLTNGERAALRDVNVAVALPEGTEGAELLPPPPAGPPPVLAPAASASHSFHLRAGRAATFTVRVRVTYAYSDPPTDVTSECVRDFSTDVTVVEPFEVSTDFAAMNFAPVSECFVDTPFVVMPQIDVPSPWDLVIEDAELEVTEWFRRVDGEGAASCIGGVEVSRGGVAVDAVCVAARGGAEAGAALRSVGRYAVRWRRADASAVVRSSYELAPLRVSPSPLHASLRCPAVVPLRGRVTLECSLRSSGPQPVRIALAMEGSDAFMVSGYRRVSLSLPAITADASSLSLPFSVRALLPGPAPPPRLTATLLDQTQAHMQDAVTHMFDHIFPHSIFVVPDYIE